MARKLAAHARATVRVWRKSKRVSLALGASPFQRLSLRIVPVALHWMAPLKRPANRGVPVAFAFRGRGMRCVLGDLREYDLLREVFVEETYRAGLPARATRIVDLGSNVGLSILYFLARYPDAQILAVEPNPAVLGRLRRNLRRFGRVTVVPLAVADRNGQARLSVPSGSTSARLCDDDGYAVRTATLDAILAEHRFLPVDVLKFDIEGAEFQAFKAADLSQVGALVGELHPEDPGQLQELIDVLARDFAVETRPLPPRPLLQGRRRQPATLAAR